MTRSKSNLPSLMDSFEQGARRISTPTAANSPGGSVDLPTKSPREVQARKERLKFIIAIVLFSIAGLWGAYQILNRPESPASAASKTVAISESGEVFMSFAMPNARPPWKNPKTGAMDVWPAEACWYDRSGEVRPDPVYVRVMPETSAKCPDCGRDVVISNPSPSAQRIKAAQERAAAQKAAGGK